MKKLKTLFLLVTIILNAFAFNMVYAEGNLTEKQQTLLELLEVCDANFSFDEKLTKGEFAYMLSKAAFRYGYRDVMIMPSSENKITDVNDSTDYVDVINSLYDYGYLPLDGFGRFQPAENITAGEAVEMLVKTMGYSDKYVEAYGGVDALASGKKLYNNIKSRQKTEINVYEAYNFIYNMLCADISELCMYESGDTTYLEARVGLYEAKGIVTDDGINSFEGRSGIGINQLKIGDDRFDNKSGRNDLFGCSVGGFYTEESGDNVLLAVYFRKMEITSFSSALIDKFENRTYYYYDELSDKTRKAYIPNGAVIVYNGKPVEITDTFGKELFTPEDGYVKLYDNNNDNVFDILFIEDYSAGVVSSVDVQGEKIYLDGSTVIDVSNKNLFISNGKNELSLGNISKENILSYFEAVDGESVKIIVSDTRVKDTVTGYSASDYTVSVKSGAKYDVLKSAVKRYGNIEVGTTYNFYINAFGNVAAYKKVADSTQLKYGCLVKMVFDEDEDTYRVRIYTDADRFEAIDVAKKVKVIWEDDSKGTYTPKALYANLSYTGLVRYQLNGEDELNYIELPHSTGTTPTIEDRLYCLVETLITEDNPNATNGYYVTVNNSVANYGGAALITRGTSVFRLPKDNAANSTMYKVLDSSVFSQGSALEIRAYGVDYKSKVATAAAVYVEDGSNAVDAKITNDWPSVVADIVYTYNEDEGEALYELTLSDVTGNVITKALMEKEVYDNVYSVGAGNTEAVEIQPGDIIYTRKVGDYITNALLVYDMDWVVKDEHGNDVKGAIAGTKISYYSADNTLCSPFTSTKYEPGQPGIADSWKYTARDMRIFSGWVYSYEDGYIQVTNQNPAYGYSYDKNKDDGSVTQIFNYGRRVNVDVSGRNGKVMSVGAAKDSDIRSYLDYGADCTRVVITQRAYDLRSMTFYNYN